jgi:co-chaperonin GroES (HSP10)
MRPIGRYILIEKIAQEIKTDSGLILSADDASQLRYHKGKVVAVGTDVEHISPDDSIYYDSRAGYTMVIDERQLTVISQNDIVVVL